MKNFPLDFGVFGCGSGVTSIRNIRYANNTLRGQPTSLDLVRGAQEKTRHPMKEDWTFQTFLYTEVLATEGVVVMGLATAGMSHWKRKCPHKKKHPTEASHRSPFVICELCTSGKEFHSQAGWAKHRMHETISFVRRASYVKMRSQNFSILFPFGALKRAALCNKDPSLLRRCSPFLQYRVSPSYISLASSPYLLLPRQNVLLWP